MFSSSLIEEVKGLEEEIEGVKDNGCVPRSVSMSKIQFMFKDDVGKILLAWYILQSFLTRKQ